MLWNKTIYLYLLQLRQLDNSTGNDGGIQELYQRAMTSLEKYKQKIYYVQIMFYALFCMYSMYVMLYIYLQMFLILTVIM